MSSPTAFPPTRAEALRRLAAFLPRAGRDYAATRNADTGPDARQNVSQLSPYLRYRLLSEPEVAAAVLDHHGHAAAAKFVAEVAWRTYWKGWLELRPAVWARFLAERDAAREQSAHNTGLAHALEQAEGGHTGIDAFDAWAAELVQHGYLHNHARMWFASIWVFTLRLPWTLGADFFLRHLLDADPASNTLSWRWVAGLQTPGKTYLATADNIARYTDGRFQPTGLARRADALSEPPLPKPRPLPPCPEPDWHRPAVLLVHPEDFSPETALPEGADVRHVVVWPGPNLPPAAHAFVAAAADDAATRARHHWGCPVTLAGDLTAAALREFGTELVLTMAAPVGPTADRLDALATEGVELVPLRRAWDEALWPYATKGFFNFKERLPTAIGTVLGLPYD